MCVEGGDGMSNKYRWVMVLLEVTGYVGYLWLVCCCIVWWCIMYSVDSVV